MKQILFSTANLYSFLLQYYLIVDCWIWAIGVFGGDVGYSNEDMDGENKVKYWLIRGNYAFINNNVKSNF